MYTELTHRILEEVFEQIERHQPDWRVSRRLRETVEYDRFIRNLRHTIDSQLARAFHREFDLRWQQGVSELARRQAAQLDRIEEAIAANRVQCRFSEGSAEYTEFMTVKREMVEGEEKAAADPVSFIGELKKFAKTADRLVLVDPYALSKKDDSGKNVSAVGAIAEIFAECRSQGAHLHLYCRPDAIDESEWHKLRLAIGTGKLSVHLGDFHDRYILAGAERPYNGYQATFPGWHGSKYWGGAAFGSSINGSGKRPTYILNFRAADIPDLVFYLDDVAELPVTLEEFAAKKAAAAAAKEAKQQ